MHRCAASPETVQARYCETDTQANPRVRLTAPRNQDGMGGCLPHASREGFGLRTGRNLLHVASWLRLHSCGMRTAGWFTAQGVSSETADDAAYLPTTWRAAIVRAMPRPTFPGHCAHLLMQPSHASE